jgi:hypothetical protein
MKLIISHPWFVFIRHSIDEQSDHTILQTMLTVHLTILFRDLIRLICLTPNSSSCSSAAPSSSAPSSSFSSAAPSSSFSSAAPSSSFSSAAPSSSTSPSSPQHYQLDRLSKLAEIAFCAVIQTKYLRLWTPKDPSLPRSPEYQCNLINVYICSWTSSSGVTAAAVYPRISLKHDAKNDHHLCQPPPSNIVSQIFPSQDRLRPSRSFFFSDYVSRA